MRIIRSIGWIIASMILVIAIWDGVAHITNSPLMPTARNIGKVLPKVIINKDTYLHLIASIILVLKGFGLSIIIALPTSILCFRLKIYSRIVLPSHEFIRYIPVPAFVPLCAVLFGIGDLTKVILIFIGTYFQLVFIFISDFLTTPKEFEESARTLGLKGLKLIYKITIPASLSNLLNTVRITFAWAWSYLLVAEVVNATRGIGYLVIQSYRVLNMERLVVLLIVIGIFGILTDNILKFARITICPWLKNDKKK